MERTLPALALALALLALAPAIAAATNPITNDADALRTGWYPDEASLTPSLLQGGTFGQLFSTPVTGQVYAQPLLANGTLFVATEANWTYGLDPVTGHVNWSRNLGSAWNASDVGCADLTPTVGITGTPVIDPDTNTAYFFSKTYEADGVTAAWYAHAVDVASGAERSGFPVKITGAAQNQPDVNFNAKFQMQRPGLLMMNGVVYAAFGGHCDAQPEEGWVVGVSTSGTVKAKWVDGTTSAGGGIWQGGGGIMSDGANRMFVVSGNRNVNTTATPGTSPPGNLGEAVTRLQVQSDGTLRAADFFEPYDAVSLDTSDADFGSGGPVALPSQFGTAAFPNLMLAIGKEGWLYLLNRDNLGGYEQGSGGGDLVVQRLGPQGGVWSKPATWTGDGGWVYSPSSSGGSHGGVLHFYKGATDGSGRPTLALHATASDAAFGYTSPTPIVTSNGAHAGTGIMWAVASPNNTGVGSTLRAYSAAPSGSSPQLLYSAPIGTAAKFVPPLAAGNRIYVGTRDQHVLAFGAPVSQPLTGSGADFGTVTVGQHSTKTVTLTATRNVTVSAVSSSSSQFAPGTSSPALGTALSAGDQLRIPVTFTPTASGPAGGQLNLTNSQGPISVQLSGTGQARAAELDVSPAALSLGGTVVARPVTGTVTFSNGGGQPLKITGVTHPAAPFSVSGMPANGTTMAPGASITATVTFTPTTTGYFADQIGLASDTGGNEAIPVTGTATTPPQLVIAPAALDYGSVPVNSIVDRTFAVSNPGGGPLTINKSKPPLSTSFSATTDLPEGSTVAAGTSVTESVRFHPSSTGDAAASWLITGDDGSGLQAVQFTGSGVAPQNGGATGVPSVLPPPLARLLALRLSPAVFKSGANGKRRGTLRTGTLIKFSLSRAGLVQFKVYRRVRGRSARGRCVAPSRAGRRAAPCTRYVPLSGSFDVAANGGANRFRFLGRIAGRALAVGSYKLVATPVDTYGRSAAPIRVRFKVVG